MTYLNKELVIITLNLIFILFTSYIYGRIDSGLLQWNDNFFGEQSIGSSLKKKYDE